MGEHRVFKKLPMGNVPDDEYQQIPYHFVFDVKFDLRHRARLVAGGNWTSPRGEDTYSSVVSTDSLRLAFFIAELNHLQIIATDVGKAYLHGYTKEKVYIIAGPEFGEMKGHY